MFSRPEITVLVFAMLVAGPAISGPAAALNGVAPGAVDRLAEIEGRCPTFIWETVDDALYLDLVVYRLSEEMMAGLLEEIDFSDAEQVFHRQVAGGAPAWAPARAECLEAGGGYVWFVRPVFETDGSEPTVAGDWSVGRFFVVSMAPSAQEVEDALSVLRRFAGKSGVVSDQPDTDLADRPDARPRNSTAPLLPGKITGSRSVVTATSAIRGSHSDISGEAYGVIGVTASADGAGLGAANTGGGADLVIDGSQDGGQADAVVTQDGIDRPSAAAQTFNIQNSLGDMTLQVEGSTVLTTATGSASGHDHIDELWMGGAGEDGLRLDVTGEYGIDIVNYEPSGTSYGVKALTLSTSGWGVWGHASAASGAAYGVVGYSGSAGGRGVFGRAFGVSGTTHGVYGRSDSSDGRGVFGEAPAASGQTVAVWGQAASTDARGVVGWAWANSGNTTGVWGQVASTEGRAVYGWTTANSGNTTGVWGQTESTDGRAVVGLATASSGGTTGVWGQVASTDGRAVVGLATASSGITTGVWGQTASTDGRAVVGYSTATGGPAVGVWGQATSSTGRGVYGEANHSSGTVFGVYGWSPSTSGRGVFGHASAGSGSAYGVHGRSDSANGSAVGAFNTNGGADLFLDGSADGEADAFFTQSGIDRPSAAAQTFNIQNSLGEMTLQVDGDGVLTEATGSATGHDHFGQLWTGSATDGLSASNAGGHGVSGLTSSGTGRGLYGHATATGGANYGVYGKSESTGGHGVYGEAFPVSGATFGVAGRSNSTSGTGVFGLASNGVGTNYGVHGESASSAGRGVFGKNTNSTGTTYGVFGESASDEGTGVYGKVTAPSGTSYGVFGEAAAANGRGLYGYATATSGVNHGVYGRSDSSGGRGLYGEAYSTSGFNYGVYGRSNSPDGVGLYGFAANGAGSNSGVHGYSSSASGSGVYAENGDGGTTAADLTLAGSTGVLKATDESSSDLFLYSNDNIALYLDDDGDEGGWFRVYESGSLIFRVEAAGGVYADGAYHCGQAASGTEPGTCIIQNTPADFAEMLPSEMALEPGDVLAMGDDGRLAKSRLPFQQSVIGVYSTQPGYLGGGADWGRADHAPLALVGIVPVKATVENGAIRPGDMLVASSSPGYAMRAGGRAPQGSVIGKALEPHVDGSGVIQMVVMLQ